MAPAHERAAVWGMNSRTGLHHSTPCVQPRSLWEKDTQLTLRDTVCYVITSLLSKTPASVASEFNYFLSTTLRPFILYVHFYALLEDCEK